VALYGLPAVQAAFARRRSRDAEAVHVVAVKRLEDGYQIRVVHPSAAKGDARVLDYQLRVLHDAVARVDAQAAKSSTTLA
jgi:hypothetical protein